MFAPLRTDRLLVRPFQSGDAAGLAARRNDPELARYQSWTLPYTDEQARQVVDELVTMNGPADDEWWMAAVCDTGSDDVYGEVAVRLSWQGRTAEIGYALGRDHWGRGYATEAVEAMVGYLFDDLGATRLFGMIHPDNTASAMVLERSGFLFEGHTKSSYWVGDEVSDDWIYGLVRADRETWRNRPRHSPEEVGLVEISQETDRAVYKVRTHKTQEKFVAPMKRSYADALFPEVYEGAPLVPWMRAVEADEELVGFVMLALTTDHHPEPYLWRLLIDRLHQRRGIGRRVLDLIHDECRNMGAETLLTGWVEGKGSPDLFYLHHGYEPTGRVIDGEIEARRQLS